MAFLFGKLMFLALRPSNLLLLIGLFGVVGLAGRRRWAMAPLCGAILGMAACTILPMGRWLTIPLEDRFPAAAYPAAVDGIVVLGGGIDGEITKARGQPSFGATMERFAAIPALARRYPEARIVFTGGNAWNGGDAYTEAVVIGQFLAQQGVAEGRVLLEDRARSTRENALFSLALAEPRPGQRWLLVTSAMHMPRAMGVFRALGWPGLEAWPVDYRTMGRIALLAEPVLAARLGELDDAAYEWGALLYYRLLGYTDDVFPGPAPI
ncbi:MAG: YdcF family protein [Geminicoccaceae bacterium]